MSTVVDDFESDGDDDEEELEDPRLAALVEALARGEAIDWQQAESSAGSEEEKQKIRALAAISEVATFHRTWLAEGGILGDLDEEEEQDDEVPTHWGELEILERVGRGSFGDVYKAREPRLDRIVALKLIRASAKTPEREAETLREGRLLAKVRHPNVATVHGAAGADGRVGFWMEFLEGKNLAEILAEKGRFEAREAAEIGIALCRALAAVHAQGIVHRDVKAQNVVRENDGRIVLTDFGVGRDTALVQSEEPSLSGTPLYLAPELFEGKHPTPASDLYALGVLLFYLVTGEFPVTGNTFEELRAAHQGRKRQWLKELRKDLPGTFVAAVERALDRDSQKRAGVGELERELGRFLGERAQVRRLKKVLLAAAMIVATSMIAFWGYSVRRSQMRRQALFTESKQFAEDDLDGAVQTLEDFLKKDPGFVDGWSRLGLRQQTQGLSSKSRESFLKGRSLCSDDDDSVSCVRAKAYVHLSSLEYEKAVPLFERVVGIESCDSISWRQIAMAYNNMVRPQDGISAAKAALECTPSDKLVAGLWPQILAEASDSRALDAVLETRRRIPNESYLYWSEGIAYMVLGESEKAFAAFENLGQDPEYSSLGQIFKGQIRLEQGHLPDAEVMLAKGLSVDQGISSREVAQRHILLAEIAVRRSDPEDAKRHLETLLAGDGGLEVIPDNLKYYRTAAIVAVRARSVELAERFSKDISFLAQKFPSTISQALEAQVLGEIAELKGDKVKAIRLVNDAFDKRPEPLIEASLLRLLLDRADCDRVAEYSAHLQESPGLIYSDYSVPWIEIREAIDLAKSCARK